MSSYGGKGGPPSAPAGSPCPVPGCGKHGHTKERCWKLHPELMPERVKRKLQGLDEERNLPTDLGGVIKICAVEITDAKQDTVSSPSPSSSSVCEKKTIGKQKGQGQTGTPRRSVRIGNPAFQY